MLYNDTKQTLVVPAFQRQGKDVCVDGESCRQVLLDNPDFMPSTFDSLRSCLSDKECIVFQYDNNPQGHSTTNTPAWVKRTQEGVKALECFENNRYEAVFGGSSLQ